MKPQLLLQKSTLIKFLLILYIGIFGIAKAQVSVIEGTNYLGLGNSIKLVIKTIPYNTTVNDYKVTISPEEAGEFVYISPNGGDKLGKFVSSSILGLVTITATSVSNPLVSSNHVLTIIPAISVQSINIELQNNYPNGNIVCIPKDSLFFSVFLGDDTLLIANRDLIFEISDPNLGSVTKVKNNYFEIYKGKYRFLANTISGIVTVTARSVSNPSVSEKIVISIKENITLTGLYLRPYERVMVNSQTYLDVSYTPTYTSEKSIIWTVEPSNLGYIDGYNNFIAGSITGIVTITATSASNSNIKSTTIIEISLFQIPIAELETIVIETQQVTADGSNLTITMMTISGSTSYCFKYSTDPLFQTNVVTVCGLAFPRYTVSFSFINGRKESKNLYWQIGAVDANGNTYWSSTQRYESVTSISNTELANSSRKIEIHPNPGTDFIHIEGLKPSESISIFDLSGKLILLDTKSDLDIKDLPQGIYIIKVANKVSKFIKL